MWLRLMSMGMTGGGGASGAPAPAPAEGGTPRRADIGLGLCNFGDITRSRVGSGGLGTLELHRSTSWPGRVVRPRRRRDATGRASAHPVAAVDVEGLGDDVVRVAG